MPEPSHFHPLRGYSPFRALALRLREQFRAEDAARAAAREAAPPRRDAAHGSRATARALLAAGAAAPEASAPETPAHRLVH